MCGIIGYSGTKEIKQEDLKVLLYFAEDRGDESCGVATPEIVVKKAEDPHVFIRKELPVHKTIIGHTRKATTGKVSDENSHPFQNGDYVGVHNGSIYNFQALQRQEDTDYNVDSEIIWHLFNKYGIAEALPKLSGWLGLAWIDKEERLNLYRHTAPVHIGYKDDALYFGSEKTYLEVLDCDDIEKIDRNYHYIIEEGEIIDKVDYTDYKYKPRSSSYRRGQASGGQNTQADSGDDHTREDFPRPEGVPGTADLVVVDNPPGVGYYYWFSMSKEKLLYVQPTTPLMGNWVPKLETFDLNDQYATQRLHRGYPEVANAQEVYSKIEDQIGKHNYN